MTGTYGPNFLFGPAIGGAIGEGIQQGQQANALALATQAARSGDYGALGNALLQLGDVKGAMKALGTPYERQRQKTLDEQAREQAELQRRNIESEIKAREAATGARDLRAVGDQVVDFSDPQNPRVVFSKPDPFADVLGGGGQPAGAPAPAMPVAAPGMTAAAPPAPPGAQFGPRALAATDLATGKGNLQAGVTGGLPQVGARPPAPVDAAPVAAKTLADLTPQQRQTALDLIRTGNRTGAEKYVADILTGATAKKEVPTAPAGYRNILDAQGNIVSQEPIPGGPASVPKAPTEYQSKSAGYYDRMIAADAVLSEPAAVGQAQSALQQGFASMPGGYYLMSPDRQRYEQAKADFITAKLRQESGASIGPSEFTKAERTWFPQPGEDAKAVAQKAKARRTAIQGMLRDAGPNYKPAQQGGTEQTTSTGIQWSVE